MAGGPQSRARPSADGRLSFSPRHDPPQFRDDLGAVGLDDLAVERHAGRKEHQRYAEAVLIADASAGAVSPARALRAFQVVAEQRAEFLAQAEIDGVGRGELLEGRPLVRDTFTEAACPLYIFSRHDNRLAICLAAAWPPHASLLRWFHSPRPFI